MREQEAALLVAATDAVVMEYRDHFLESEEAAAMTWLKQQARPGK